MVSRHSAMSPARRREALAGYLFISPWILGFLLFTFLPMVASLGLSFFKWDMLSPAEFVGWENLQKLASDRYFKAAIRVTLIYTFTSVPLGIAVGFGIALMLNQKIKALSIWRTIYYLPAVISGVAVSLLWSWVFNPDFGLLNEGLRTLGVSDPPGWLSDRHWALPAMILMQLWSAGGGMVVYLAGLQSVPTQLYEAATIDGAGVWHRFAHITVPMMTPVLFFQTVMGMINAFQTFTQAYVMTEGGPSNATLFYVLYLYKQAFQSYKMGYACVLAWVLFLIILALTMLLFSTSRRWVFYSDN